VVPTPTRSDAVFKAIADPTRREILALLHQTPTTVGSIASRFRISRPAVSRHIRLLRRAGLVVAHRRGTNRICELDVAPLRAVGEWLADYDALRTQSQDLGQFAEDAHGPE
jgi:DNA-binding transcriptional ArsR family regulator